MWDPFQMAFAWLINGDDPNHVTLPGMILQVGLIRQLHEFCGFAAHDSEAHKIRFNISMFNIEFEWVW